MSVLARWGALWCGPMLCCGIAGCELVGPTSSSFRPADPPAPVLNWQGSNSSQSALDRGIELLRLGEPALAHKAFIRAIRTEQDTAAALTGAGVAAERLGQLSKAEAYFQTVAKLSPSSVLAQNNLGVIQFRRGNYVAARHAFQRAFALSSGQNDLARRNILVAEEALVGRLDDSDVATSHALVRLGSSEYRLSEMSSESKSNRLHSNSDNPHQTAEEKSNES